MKHLISIFGTKDKSLANDKYNMPTLISNMSSNRPRPNLDEARLKKEVLDRYFDDCVASFDNESLGRENI